MKKLRSVSTRRSLPIALLRTREAVMQQFRPHLNELGLTEQQMLWAIATRTQMDRDALILSDLPGSILDPSLEPGQVNTAKMGIDARWKSAVRPQRNRVPAAVLEAMSKVSSQTNAIP